MAEITQQAQGMALRQTPGLHICETTAECAPVPGRPGAHSSFLAQQQRTKA